jgi:hypothetical protein
MDVRESIPLTNSEGLHASNGAYCDGASQPSQQLRESFAEGARERRNGIEPGLCAPSLHLDNRVFGKPAVNGEIGKAPAARFAEPLDALAEPYLQGL